MLLVIIVADGARQNDTKWYRAAWSGALDHLRRTTPASVHQVAYRHQLEARMAVVRGNTLESGYMLLVPHTTALARAEPVTSPCCRGADQNDRREQPSSHFLD